MTCEGLRILVFSSEPSASGSLDDEELLVALILVGAEIGSTSSAFKTFNWRPRKICTIRGN